MGFLGDSTVKNMPAMQETQETGSIPGSGRSPGGGHGNPVQYSCLETPMDRGAWRATVHGVAQSQTRLRILACTNVNIYTLLYLSGWYQWDVYLKVIS